MIDKEEGLLTPKDVKFYIYMATEHYSEHKETYAELWREASHALAENNIEPAIVLLEARKNYYQNLLIKTANSGEFSEARKTVDLSERAIACLINYHKITWVVKDGSIGPEF